MSARTSPSPAEPTEGVPPPEFVRVVASLEELADDASVPRNIRRGAQTAKGELAKTKVARDMRIATVVHLLDDLANDPNLPTHGRTTIWSIISTLESLQ
ncbi:MAG TPA: UPF0147 family protein [Thermoplasmata archaeon]|nr:UPF0147 family protein [Thermoplasmata archaeon]